MGRIADIIGTLATSFGIGPKGARGLVDMGSLTANRTYTMPDRSGIVALMGKVPFFLANGTESDIPLTAGQAVPFFLASGAESDIPLTA